VEEAAIVGRGEHPRLLAGHDPSRQTLARPLVETFTG
jgi:hypothetical protein